MWSWATSQSHLSSYESLAHQKIVLLHPNCPWLNKQPWLLYSSSIGLISQQWVSHLVCIALSSEPECCVSWSWLISHHECQVLWYQANQSECQILLASSKPPKMGITSFCRLDLGCLKKGDFPVFLNDVNCIVEDSLEFGCTVSVLLCYNYATELYSIESMMLQNFNW
jgi:hypothetical protein